MDNEKYVWLNMNTGEFSNSWDDNTHSVESAKSIMELATDRGWKLIKYNCINDADFSFYDLMKIVTNTKQPLDNEPHP